MKMPKGGQKGFTLIELFIGVAIIGVLAAVVIPNVERFIGRGESEAEAEYINIQSAVVAMMVDNGLSGIPNPVGTRTNDMNLFPDIISDDTTDGNSDSVFDKVTDPNGNAYDFTAAGDDVIGYRLYGHDVTGDSANTTLVNYVATQNTSYWYTIDASGTITQYDSAL